MKDKHPYFLPQWTSAVEYIHKNSTIDNENDVLDRAEGIFNLDWFSSRCCFTGEAYFHQSAPMKCDDCRTFTYNYSGCVLEISDFYKFKNDLAEHLQEAHKEVWAKWNKAGKELVA